VTQIKMGKKMRRVLSEAFPTPPHAAPARAGLLESFI